MKLARPDVFHPRVVLAGCPGLVTGDGDDDGLVGALRRRGLFAKWLSWDDPETARADVVILRATRDYADRLHEFLAWTTTVRQLLNPAAAVGWNADRRYLLDLAGRGVPIVPSAVFGPGERVRLPAGSEVVVKPGVGTGSMRFTDPAAALRHAADLHRRGISVLVQPYDARIDREGETVLVFLGGKASHAFTKADALTAAEPDFELWDVGFDALQAAAGQLGIAAAELLYARVELIGGIHDARLLELDLIDPSLGWRQLDPDTRERQQRQFALSVESALERLGLGPLSHRRP